jgi:hypothetical protein
VNSKMPSAKTVAWWWNRVDPLHLHQVWLLHEVISQTSNCSFIFLENLCKEHQNRYYDLPWSEYLEKCIRPEPLLREKAHNGTLELMDIHHDCFAPTCKGANYIALQCSDCLPEWCWCSRRDGIRIEGTLGKGLTQRDCGMSIHIIGIFV